MSATPSLRPGRRPDEALHEQWRRRLARFEQGNLSAAAFCSSEGVSLPSFYSWRRRLRPAAPPEQDGPRLVPGRPPRYPPAPRGAGPAPRSLRHPASNLSRRNGP